ncbi:hypothetical protein [Pseudomonas nitroreducens]|uniref:Uncharacterized protein n=1 Tax=Pseudomonas nitroreducens TaxID=46680 RepID=A0A6G6IYP9_PSENT|nr:hypothetical protein [Pseudomonas nitroreducens]QIE88087.1 hypothetical protein G5B91_18140 [Pseudomonas nitroreducens]
MKETIQIAPNERDDFEVAYAAEYQATLGATCAARDIADMREGDRYPSGLHYLNGQWKGWQARAALAAQRAADGIEAPTVVGALILGGAVSSTELGDNDITLDSQVVERLQRELVKDSEDIAVELMLVGQHYRVLQALRAERDMWMQAAGRSRGEVTAYIAERAKLLEQAAQAGQLLNGWMIGHPTKPGAYYVRGFRLFEGDSPAALVEIALDGDELVCNLHESNSEEDLGRWSPLSDFNEGFEWFGPLSPMPEQGGAA